MVFLKKQLFKEYKLNSIYNYEKITSLFKNFDTMSFLDLIFNYKDLINSGYNTIFFKRKLTYTTFIAIFFTFDDGISFHFNDEHFKKIRKY